MATSGNTLVFSACKSGNSKIYYGTVPLSGYISSTLSDSLSYIVTGLAYKSSSLITGIQYGSDTRIYSGSPSDPISAIGSYVESFSNTNLISLAADSEFIFMSKNATGDADEKRTVYFTDTTSNIDKGIIYHSKWYTGDF
jgi:hypothetical protein